jgi:sporulation-control protein
MLQKILATLGVGGASIETTVPATVAQGETLQGTLVVRGGSVPQEVREVVLALRAPAHREVGDRTVSEALTVAHARVAIGTAVGPGTRYEARFELPVPLDCPVSMGPTHLMLATGLDIPGAVDPSDRDLLRVTPDAVLGGLLEACAALGFAHQSRSGEVAYQRRGWFGAVPLQEFKFRPQGGPYGGVLDELELVVARDGQALDVMVEIDHRGGLLGEMLDVDETHARLRIPPDRQFAASDLDAFLRSRVRR